MEEGIYYEMEGIRELLYQAIQSYANDVAGTAIAYEPATHPYFFIDTNGNGTVDADEANGDNRFNAWTARLLKAAYNYQTSLKDPGAYTHNAPDILQVLYDSIEDVGGDVSAMMRP